MSDRYVAKPAYRRLSSQGPLILHLVDITPTVALHCAQRLLGRGIDGRAALAAFATAGRTAANKSPVSAGELEELERQTTALLDELVGCIREVKGAIAVDWHESPELLAIQMDWEAQRAAQRRRNRRK